jgi:Tfp pilus assembly protein PilN
MFTIDLLLGTAKPPRSHPLRIAGVALAFALVALALVLDDVYYSSLNRQLAAEHRALQHYEREIAGLADVAKMLQAADKRRSEVNANLAEVTTALTTHTKWSDILVTLSQNIPESVTIADLIAKREEIKSKYEYSLVLGVVAPAGPTAVEQFVRALRQALPLVSGPDGVRIISQRQQQMEGRDFEYYVVECRLKP